MRLARLSAALVLVALATVAALLALDAGRWRAAVAAGDRRFKQAPAAATWTASTLLPFRSAERILGLPDQLAFRTDSQAFLSVVAAGNGVDNGYSESRTRGELETALLTLLQGRDRLLDSEVDNLLGILAFSDSLQNGPSLPAPVARSVADFRSAVQLDPANAEAKFNLELLERELEAQGTRSGTGSASGPSRGHRGAGEGAPGSGY